MFVANEIAREIKNQTSQSLGKAMKSTGMTLATVSSEGKIKLDNFKHELDYMAIETSNKVKIKPKELNNTLWYESKYDIKQDEIEAEIKVSLDLEVGDRVLVAIVNDGVDYVVIGKVI